MINSPLSWFVASSHLQGTVAICLSHKAIPLPSQVTGQVFHYLSTFPAQMPTGCLPSTLAVGHTHHQHVTHIKLRSSDKTRLFLSSLNFSSEVKSPWQFLHCWSKYWEEVKQHTHGKKGVRSCPGISTLAFASELCKQSWGKTVWELKIRQWLQFLLPP